MAVTVKPKQAPQETTKFKVLKRPLDEPPLEANLGELLSDAIKQRTIERWLENYDWTINQLPDDEVVAGSMVKSRMHGQTLPGPAFDVRGEEKGLAFLRSGGGLLTTWPWDQVINEVLRQAKAATPAKANGKKTKPAAAPSVPAAALKPAVRELPKPVSTGEMLDLKKLKRHPLNRKPSDADVKARAESLEADGQLEDVVVRMTEGGWQIISGETRCLAAASLKWTQIRCTVIDCDDREALRLVGLYNGQRSDLNLIQKAQHIEHMCQAGMTREEAGRCVGVGSASAASNLVRLLTLPQQWQDRVASQELPETFARAIAVYANVPGLMKELEDRWTSKDEWERKEVFDSRDDLEESLQSMLKNHTRPLKGDRYYGYSDFPKEMPDSKRPTGTYKCLLTKEQIAQHRDALGIITVTMKESVWKKQKREWKSTEVEVATNVELFDRLQIPAIIALNKIQAKDRATAAGDKADAGDGPKMKSPAEVKREKAQRAVQLGHAIDEWKERVLRQETAAALRAFKPNKTIDARLLRIALHFLVDNTSYEHIDLRDSLHRCLHLKGQKEPTMAFCVANIETWQNAAKELFACLIGGETDGYGTNRAELPEPVLDEMFMIWGGQLKATWQKLWNAKDRLIEEFLQLHRKDELAALAWELQGTKFSESTGKTSIVQNMLAWDKAPDLPKSLQPAPVKGKRGGN